MLPLLQAGGVPGGYGVALLQTLLALAAVCILAWVVLKWSRGRGLAMGGRRVKVLERVPLDGRRSLYLVEVAGRVLLVGAGEQGALGVLAELDPDALPAVPEAPPLSELVAKLRRK